LSKLCILLLPKLCLLPLPMLLLLTSASVPRVTHGWHTEPTPCP
jgi:hypothetical protein